MMMLSSSSVFVNRLPRSAVSRPEGAGEALRCRGWRKPNALTPQSGDLEGAAISALPEIEPMNVLSVIAPVFKLPPKWSWPSR